MSESAIDRAAEFLARWIGEYFVMEEIRTAAAGVVAAIATDADQAVLDAADWFVGPDSDELDDKSGPFDEGAYRSLAEAVRARRE